MKSIKQLRRDADKRALMKNKDGSPIHYKQQDEVPVIGENIDVHGEWAAHHEGAASDHQQAAGKHENAAREAQADGETHLARRHQAAADLHDKASRAHTFAAKLRHNNASFYAQNRASRTAKDLTGRADSISKRLFRINEMAEHSKYHEWLNDVMKKGASKFEDHHTSLMGIKDAKRETHKHTLARNQSGHIVGSWNHRYGSGISEAVELFEASPEYQKWKEGVTSQHGDTVRFSTKPKHTPEGWNYVSTAHKHDKVVDTFLHSHRAAVLAGKHGEVARQKAMAVESLEELYPIFEEHGVFEAIDPATIHSVVGGVAGLAAGARGAYYAAKHTKEKFGEKTHKVLGRYVKNFAKGIAHPFKEDVDHFHIDISRHVDRMAKHLHAQSSAPHELAHKAHFNDEHEAVAKKHGHEAARYAGIAAHAKAKGNEGSAQATIAGAAKYARAHHGLTESNVRTLKGDQSHVKHIGTFEPGTGYAGAKVVHNAKNKSIEIHHLGRAAVIKRMVDKNPDYPSLISHMKSIWGNRLAGVKWHVNEEMTSEANYSKGAARRLIMLPGRKKVNPDKTQPSEHSKKKWSKAQKASFKRVYGISPLGEETLIEAGSTKSEMKRKYLGKSKGRTKVGTKAHPIDTEPKLVLKDNPTGRAVSRMPQPMASKGI